MWVRLFDHDYLFALYNLGFHFLLLVRLQGPFVLGFRTHALDGIHHIFLLCEKDVAEIGSPLNIVGQTLHDVGERGHGLNARVPRLFLDRISQFFLVLQKILVFIQPLLKLNNLQRIGGSDQRLAEQVVGIECDRRHQRIQLIRRHLY